VIAYRANLPPPTYTLPEHLIPVARMLFVAAGRGEFRILRMWEKGQMLPRENGQVYPLPLDRRATKIDYIEHKAFILSDNPLMGVPLAGERLPDESRVPALLKAVWGSEVDYIGYSYFRISAGRDTYRYIAPIVIVNWPVEAHGDDLLGFVAEALEDPDVIRVYLAGSFRPLGTDQQVSMMRSQVKILERFAHTLEVREQVQLERLRELMKRIADGVEGLMLSYIALLIETNNPVAVRDVQNTIALKMYSAGYGPQVPLDPAPALRMFDPEKAIARKDYPVYLTVSGLASLGMLLGATMHVGDLYLGDVMLRNRKVIGSLFFDPLQAGDTGTAGVKNYSVLLTGAQGSGKSFAGKVIIMRTLRKYGPRLRVRIIDITGEYTDPSQTEGRPFAEAVGGNGITITGENLHINPAAVPPDVFADASRRADGVMTAMSRVRGILAVALSEHPEAVRQAGKIEEILDAMYRRGPFVGVGTDGRPVFALEALFKGLLKKDSPWGRHIPGSLTLQARQMLTEDGELQQAWNRLLKVVKTKSTVLADPDALLFGTAFFYRTPTIADAAKVLDALVSHGMHQYEHLRTALSPFVHGHMRKIFSGRENELPEASERIVSLYVDRAVFSEREREVLYTLLISVVLDEAIRYQMQARHQNNYYMIVLDEAWRVLQTEAAQRYIINTLARDIRKYRISALLMSQQITDFFATGERATLGASFDMRFFGATADKQDLEYAPITEEARQNLLATGVAGTQYLRGSFVLSVPAGQALVRVNPTPEELNYAKSILQQ